MDNGLIYLDALINPDSMTELNLTDTHLAWTIELNYIAKLLGQ